MATIAPSLQIALAGAPSLSMKVGSTFGLTVDVEYQSGGAIDTGYDGTVSLSIPGAAPGTLAGNTSVTATNGVAAFTGLSFTDSGSFSIQVTSGSATALSVGPIQVAGPTGSSPVNPGGPPIVPSPPVVESERLVISGKGKNRFVSGIVLNFSAALDPASAANVANYTVTQVTKAGRAKAVKAVRLRAAYIPARDAVKLTLSGKPRFTAGGQLRLVAIAPSGIASSSGVYLEGNMGNQSGADGLYTILPAGRGIAD